MTRPLIDDNGAAREMNDAEYAVWQADVAVATAAASAAQMAAQRAIAKALHDRSVRWQAADLAADDKPVDAILLLQSKGLLK